MTDRYPPIVARRPGLLHGADYNPEQWTPDVWEQDMRLMRQAGCSIMSIGIFSWSMLEPSEGQFEFDWLDRVMDILADNGIVACLATPSGARPAWLSQKYPEVLRVRADRVRIRHSRRHNHCPTSPAYRQKVAAIDRRIAERYKDHPALGVWHVSNEYRGGMEEECHCPLCQQAFRQWLQQRYGSLEALNHAWWTTFWSRRFTDWEQIESPSPVGEDLLMGLALDWKRFVTDQVVDFYRQELVPLRELTPDVPVTTNMMPLYHGLNYWKFAPDLDIASLNSYPAWQGDGDDWRIACTFSFTFDMNRCLKAGRPFMLMESSPSTTVWQPAPKLKRPGVHKLSSLHAVAHGADTVQYFQWRKGRGASEKFFGAVVDHCGHENTRVFADVADVGQALAKLDGVAGTTVRPDVAIIYDWENRWAIDGSAGPGHGIRRYHETCVAHYEPFWSAGVSVDVIDADQPIEGYKLLIAPMLYLLRPGFAERAERFVAAGGTFVATYMTGWVNESDLCFLGGFPGPLRKLLGVWSEEIDALPDGQTNRIVPDDANDLGLTGAYDAITYCERIHAESAEVLARYGEDFYAGEPAMTVSRVGQGRAYYLAARSDSRLLQDFYAALRGRLGIGPNLPGPLPEGVTVQRRGDGRQEYLFVLNFTPTAQTVELGDEPMTDVLAGGSVSGALELEPFALAVLRVSA